MGSARIKSVRQRLGLVDRKSISGPVRKDIDKFKSKQKFDSTVRDKEQQEFYGDVLEKGGPRLDVEGIDPAMDELRAGDPMAVQLDFESMPYGSKQNKKGVISWETSKKTIPASRVEGTSPKPKYILTQDKGGLIEIPTEDSELSEKLRAEGPPETSVPAFNIDAFGATITKPNAERWAKSARIQTARQRLADIFDVIEGGGKIKPTRFRPFGKDEPILQPDENIIKGRPEEFLDRAIRGWSNTEPEAAHIHRDEDKQLLTKDDLKRQEELAEYGDEDEIFRGDELGDVEYYRRKVRRGDPLETPYLRVEGEEAVGHEKRRQTRALYEEDAGEIDILLSDREGGKKTKLPTISEDGHTAITPEDRKFWEEHKRKHPKKDPLQLTKPESLKQYDYDPTIGQHDPRARRYQTPLDKKGLVMPKGFKSSRIQMARERLGAVGKVDWSKIISKQIKPKSYIPSAGAGFLSPKGEYFGLKNPKDQSHEMWLKRFLKSTGDESLMEKYDPSFINEGDSSYRPELQSVNPWLKDSGMMRLRQSGSETFLSSNSTPTSAQIRSLKTYIKDYDLDTDNLLVDDYANSNLETELKLTNRFNAKLRQRIGAVGNMWESLAEKHATPITYKQHRTISWLSPNGKFYDAEEFGGSEHRDWIESLLKNSGNNKLLEDFTSPDFSTSFLDAQWQEDSGFARVNTYGGGELDVGFGDEPTKAQSMAVQDLAISRGYKSKNVVVDGISEGSGMGLEDEQLRRRMGLHKLGKLRQRMGRLGYHKSFMNEVGELEDVIDYQGFSNAVGRKLKGYGVGYSHPRHLNMEYGTKIKNFKGMDDALDEHKLLRVLDDDEGRKINIGNKATPKQLEQIRKQFETHDKPVLASITSISRKRHKTYNDFLKAYNEHSGQSAPDVGDTAFKTHTRNMIGEPLTEKQLRESKLRQRIAGLGFRERILNWLKEQPRFKSFDPDSSFVGTVKYDQDNQSMQITLNGKKYDFCNVEERLFDSFSGAGSKGAFFNREIKSLHNCGAW